MPATGWCPRIAAFSPTPGSQGHGPLSRYNEAMKQAMKCGLPVLLMLLLATSAFASACLVPTAGWPGSAERPNAVLSANFPGNAAFGRVENPSTHSHGSIRTLRFEPLHPGILGFQPLQLRSWMEHLSAAVILLAPSVAPDSSRAPPRFTPLSR